MVGCPQRTAIWLAADSAPNRPVFLIADRRGGDGDVAIRVLRVDACTPLDTARSPLWGIADAQGAGNLRRVEYGVVPPGWSSFAGPRRLSPGCYRATISGSGRVEFQVEPDGDVRELADAR